MIPWNKITTLCPVCGSEGVSTYYYSEGEIVGCEECIYDKNAWEVEHERYEDALIEMAEADMEDRKNGFL